MSRMQSMNPGGRNMMTSQAEHKRVFVGLTFAVTAEAIDSSVTHDIREKGIFYYA